MFAKLYGTDQDQVLVKIDSNEDGKPEVRFYFTPADLGVCSIAVGFEDSNEGWDKADAYFAGVDETSAMAVASEQKTLIESSLQTGAFEEASE